MRILFVHGIGHQSVRQGWQDSWLSTVERGLKGWDANATVVPHFVNLDTIFDQPDYVPTWSSTATALWRLMNSCWFGVRYITTVSRENMQDVNRWTAGMVVQWVESDQLRRQTREYLRREVAHFQPDCIMAHSLGSLVAYDAFTHPGNPLQLPDGTFVSFGSQIGSCYVIRNFAQGRLTSVPVRRWFHLFNEHDQVFTAKIDIPVDSGFRQVETPFDAPDWLNHDAAPSSDNPEPSLTYLGHRNTSDVVYRELAASAGVRAILNPDWIPAAIEQRSQSAPLPLRTEQANKRKALLIGINDYPEPGMRLEGCVNDVFLMSSVLQERGFEADQIRTVLNNRATADAIRERLHWLLDDALPGDERVLFYSGHGAQLPAYSASEVVDHVDECLVPWDFDWSPERAIIDDEFCRLYTQLSYDVRFVSIFDCCHSGGIARGSMLRARGIDPPDDIRHRLMQWNADLQVWQSREIHPAAMEAKLAPKEFSRTNGQSGNLYRLGRAARIRGRGDKMLKKLATKRGHDGPYMPLILEACQEGESAYEYRDGVTSYGAFTFSLAKVLRSHFADQPVPFSTLLQNSLTMISDQNGFGYPQHPQLEGPTVWKNSPIPFGLEAPERKHASPPVRAAKRSRTRK